jgi:hypothetical protein
MEALLRLVGSLAPWLQLVVFLVIVVVFRGEIAEAIRKALGIRKGEEEKQEKVPVWAQTLTAHFNHETTDNQNSILLLLQALHARQDAMCKSLDTICNDIDDIRVNGIRIRK